MLIGVPKEIKSQDSPRLTPDAAREYGAHGHRLLVETGAGTGIGADNDVYRAAGADIAATATEIFASADMIVKVKEPQPSEWAQLREGADPLQLVFTSRRIVNRPRDCLRQA
jgi:alanine dehydrogenase